MLFLLLGSVLTVEVAAVVVWLRSWREKCDDGPRGDEDDLVDDEGFPDPVLRNPLRG